MRGKQGGPLVFVLSSVWCFYRPIIRQAQKLYYGKESSETIFTCFRSFQALDLISYDLTQIYPRSMHNFGDMEKTKQKCGKVKCLNWEKKQFHCEVIYFRTDI